MGSRGGLKVNDHENTSRCLCTDCKVDLASKGCKSIKCDFCLSWYCCKCSKLKQSLFNEIGKEESVLWTCYHCRIALPGVRNMMSKITCLESKLEDVSKTLNEISHSRNNASDICDKETVRNLLREEKDEEQEIEKRRLNIVINSLPESKKQKLDYKKSDDESVVNNIIKDVLNVDTDFPKES